MQDSVSTNKPDKYTTHAFFLNSACTSPNASSFSKTLRCEPCPQIFQFQYCWVNSYIYLERKIPKNSQCCTSSEMSEPHHMLSFLSLPSFPGHFLFPLQDTGPLTATTRILPYHFLIKSPLSFILRDTSFNNFLNLSFLAAKLFDNTL